MQENKENKVLKFGYEDTDKKIEIEIYGLRFEINNLDSNSYDKYKNIDKDLSTLEKEIDFILGDGAVEKINAKRISDGYDKMDLNVELALLGCIFETYANSVTGNLFNKVDSVVNNTINKIDSYKNREQRRNNKYNRNNNYNRNYRNNRYRRY